MKPYILKDADGNQFAEGMTLSDGRCFLSFLRADYTFVYDNIDQLSLMHSIDEKNKLEYISLAESNDQEKNN